MATLEILIGHVRTEEGITSLGGRDASHGLHRREIDECVVTPIAGLDLEDRHPSQVFGVREPPDRVQSIPNDLRRRLEVPTPLLPGLIPDHQLNGGRAVDLILVVEGLLKEALRVEGSRVDRIVRGACKRNEPQASNQHRHRNRSSLVTRSDRAHVQLGLQLSGTGMCTSARTPPPDARDSSSLPPSASVMSREIVRPTPIPA